MKKPTGGKFMNSIEADAQILKRYLLKESDGTKEWLFWGESEYDKKDSAWKEYGQCRHMGGEIMRYDFEYPVELEQRLQELWDGAFTEEFIRNFSAAVFRRKENSAREKRAEDVEIPAYIYNF